MIKKMQKVETAIKQRKGNFNEKVQIINTFFFRKRADFIQLVVFNLNHLNYIKLYLFLTFNKR